MFDGRAHAATVGAAETAAGLHAEFAENVDADVTLRLLRSRSALVYLAMMGARLGDGHVDGDRLHAGIHSDIQDLESHWRERGVAVPTSEELVDRWVREGFVARTLESGRGDPGHDHPVRDVERYHLTRGATTALAQVRAVRHDRSVATETAMQMVIDRLANIAVALHPDPGEHVRHIDIEIARLTARRAELAAGRTPEIDPRGIADDIRLVTSLAERMPADIIGYGERLRENSRTLLTGGLDDRSGAYADTLNRMFDGHDELAQTPEGVAFDAFYALIADHRLRESLDDHIETIVARSPGLPDDQATTLRRFIDRMWDEVQRVDEIRGQVYRRINTFVKGGDFLHYRVLREQIVTAQRAAAAAFEHTPPGRDMGIAVPMTPVDAQSVGALSLHDGVVPVPDDVAATAGEIVIDPARLVGAETIDWAALTHAVNDAVRDGPADLSSVLDRLDEPRVGDVVGVWSLAQRHGTVIANAPTSVVGARTSAGVRTMTLPCIVFREPLQSPATSVAAPTHLLDDMGR